MTSDKKCVIVYSRKGKANKVEGEYPLNIKAESSLKVRSVTGYSEGAVNSPGREPISASGADSVRS